MKAQHCRWEGRWEIGKAVGEEGGSAKDVYEGPVLQVCVGGRGIGSWAGWGRSGCMFEGG